MFILRKAEKSMADSILVDSRFLKTHVTSFVSLEAQQTRASVLLLSPNWDMTPLLNNHHQNNKNNNDARSFYVAMYLTTHADR